jgi:hypothetical protein
MSLIDANCVQYNDSRPLGTADENGKKYVIENVSGYQLRKVKIDKCIKAGENGKKCDYLFHLKKDHKQVVFFVELKGGKVTKGLKQVATTLELLSNEFVNAQLMVRIIGSRSVPGINSDEKFKSLFKKVAPTGGNIKIATNKYLKDII